MYNSFWTRKGKIVKNVLTSQWILLIDWYLDCCMQSDHTSFTSEGLQETETHLSFLPVIRVILNRGFTLLNATDAQIWSFSCEGTQYWNSQECFMLIPLRCTVVMYCDVSFICSFIIFIIYLLLSHLYFVIYIIFIISLIYLPFFLNMILHCFSLNLSKVPLELFPCAFVHLNLNHENPWILITVMCKVVISFCSGCF